MTTFPAFTLSPASFPVTCQAAQLSITCATAPAPQGPPAYILWNVKVPMCATMAVSVGVVLWNEALRRGVDLPDLAIYHNLDIWRLGSFTLSLMLRRVHACLWGGYCLKDQGSAWGNAWGRCAAAPGVSSHSSPSWRAC